MSALTSWNINRSENYNTRASIFCTMHQLARSEEFFVREMSAGDRARLYSLSPKKPSCFRLFDYTTATTLRAQKRQRRFAILAIAWIAVESKYQRGFVGQRENPNDGWGSSGPGGVCTGSSGSFQKTESPIVHWGATVVAVTTHLRERCLHLSRSSNVFSRENEFSPWAKRVIPYTLCGETSPRWSTVSKLVSW